MKNRTKAIFIVLFIGLFTAILNIYLDTNSNTINNKIKNQWALLNNGQAIKSINGKKGFDINIIGAWNKTLGNNQVIVGVLDTGIEISNPKIANSIFVNDKEIPNNHKNDDKNGFVDDVNGWDFYNNDNSVYDTTLSDYHGTFVTSLISSSHNNGEIWGIAPNIKILPLKFMKGSSGDISDAIKAIDYAYKTGARIINCSWYTTKYDSGLYETNKKYKDILFICSSGKGHNDLNKTPVYPACFNLENVICVGAVNNDGKAYEFSGYGLKGEVSSPGENLLGMLPEGELIYSDGTSFATAYVTGVAALVKSYKLNITATRLAIILKSSNKPADEDLKKSGLNGIIDAELCIELASQNN